VKYPFAIVLSLLPKAKTLPFSVLVPDLSVTLVMAPTARPNSAS
jgi:hypothetical protein